MSLFTTKNTHSVDELKLKHSPLSYSWNLSLQDHRNVGHAFVDVHNGHVENRSKNCTFVSLCGHLHNLHWRFASLQHVKKVNILSIN